MRGPMMALLLSAACAVGGRAVAEELPRVAVLPFAGATGTRVVGAVEAALRDRVSLVAASTWDAAARRLFATTHGAGDVAAVAADLGVQVVVTGTTRRDGEWALLVSVRSGATGEAVEKLRYPIVGPPPDDETVRRLVRELPAAVARVAAASPAPGGAGAPPSSSVGSSDAAQGDADAPAPDAATPTNAARAPTGDAATPTGDASAPTRDAATTTGAVTTPTGAAATPTRAATTPAGAPAAAIERQRPPWAPYFDLSVGFTYSDRRFQFDTAGAPKLYESTGAPGLRLDATLFPFAALAARPGAGAGVLAGLGVGATFDDVLWPDAAPCVHDMAGGCKATSEAYGVAEYRFEAGLRWHWGPSRKADHVEVLAALEYGLHSSSVGKRRGGGLVGPPDVAYQYLTVGLGLRLPLGHVLAIVPRAHLHAPLLGGVGSDFESRYGAAGGYGLRASAAVELTLWEGLTVALAGFYERFHLAYDGKGPPVPAGSATDEPYGAMLTIGWVEHRGAALDTDGDGVPDPDDRCPELAGPRENGGCPIPDTDGDGVADRDDRCPDDPGPAATHGCPDRDHDGVADKDDQCPDEPGPASSHGCPPPPPVAEGAPTVKVAAGRLELSEKIFFAYDRAEILPKSFPILDEVVKVLLEHAELRVGVHGHTDATGGDRHNLELSTGRARAVVDYLTAHGVDAARLEPKGFGARYPIDSNKTLSGRENNRRVEFILLGR